LDDSVEVRDAFAVGFVDIVMKQMLAKYDYGSETIQRLKTVLCHDAYKFADDMMKERQTQNNVIPIGGRSL